MKWIPSKLGRDGDLEVNLRIPNPVESGNSIGLHARVYRKYDGMVLGWVVLRVGHASRMELFRVYREDVEEVKRVVEEGMRVMFGAIVDVLETP